MTTFSLLTAKKEDLSPSEIISFHEAADRSPRMRELLIGAIETRLFEIEKEIAFNRENETIKIKQMQKHANLMMEWARETTNLKIHQAVNHPAHWTQENRADWTK